MLTNLVVVGLLCLQLFPFQALEIRRIEQEKSQVEAIYLEWREVPEIGRQMEEEMKALEEDLARLYWVHRADPTPLLLKGLEEAGHSTRARIEDILPLPLSHQGGVRKLSWRVTVRADYPYLKEFFASLEPLPFLVSGEEFSIVVEEEQFSQTQFTIFAFLK